MTIRHLRIFIEVADCGKMRLAEGLIKSDELVKIPVGNDELVIVVGKPHDLYKKTIDLVNLNNVDYISREDGSVERNQYERLLSENNISLTTKWSSSNTEAIKRAVIDGKGIAILSNRLVKEEVHSGDLSIVKVNGVNVIRKYILIHHKDKYLSREILKLIDVAKNIS